MSSSAQLRAKARQTLGNNLFGQDFLYPVLVCLIYSALVSLLGLTGVGLIVATGPLMVGLSLYFIRLVRYSARPDEITVMFDGFKNGFLSNFLSYILMLLYISLWSLLIIPAFIKPFSYAMTPYILADHPEYSANQAITESRRIMNGNKMRLFFLSLSFLGWIILSMFLFGIPLFWVIPYMQTATTHFYEEIRDDSYSYVNDSAYKSSEKSSSAQQENYTASDDQDFVF